MKTILIIIDGVSEEKISSLSNKTPLEYAHTPVLDKIIRDGNSKRTIFYPEGKNPDSLNCILKILGVNDDLIPENRAYLEALAADINLDEKDICLRCNLVSLKDGNLYSFNGMGLSKFQMEKAADNVKAYEDIKLYNIGEYRNILSVNKDKVGFKIKNFPPHENIGESIDVLFEDITKIDVLDKFTKENRFIVNNTEYLFYPWGISEAVKLPSFYDLHKKSCSCICKTEIVKGIAKAMDIHIPLMKNSTGDVDTDLKEKAEVALLELKSYDTVIIHVNGADEAAHRKDLWGKIKFIERIDQELLRPIYENSDEIQIIITADHQTSSITGKHEKGSVDFIISKKNGGYLDGESNHGSRNNLKCRKKPNYCCTLQDI